jgi:hypothetical protein
MRKLERVTFACAVMGGRLCIRGMRVTVGTSEGAASDARERHREAVCNAFDGV